MINKAGYSAATNFPVDEYEEEIESLQKMTPTELVAYLRARVSCARGEGLDVPILCIFSPRAALMPHALATLLDPTGAPVRA